MVASGLFEAGLLPGGTVGGLIALAGGVVGEAGGPIVNYIEGPVTYDLVPHSALLTEMNGNDADQASPGDFMPNPNYLSIVGDNPAPDGGTFSHIHVPKAVVLADAIFEPLRTATFWSLFTGDFVFPSETSGDKVVAHS